VPRIRDTRLIATRLDSIQTATSRRAGRATEREEREEREWVNRGASLSCEQAHLTYTRKPLYLRPVLGLVVAPVLARALHLLWGDQIMKFEVNKFLTLSALLAGAASVAVACSSTDSKKAEGSGGEGGGGGTTVTAAGSSGKGSAGESNAGASEGGALAAGGAAGAGAGVGGAAEAGASAGGAPEGGASEGGATGEGACIAELVGEGGAAAEGTTPCDVWTGVDVPDCGNELGNFATQLCGNLLYEVRPAVLAAFNTCVSGVGDVCSATGVQGCASGLIGKGCAQTGTTAACTFITSKCSDASLNNCPAILNLVTADAQSAAQDCMDPAGQTFDTAFTGTCENRLIGCLHLSL
jgi:hypothetical protein